METKFVGIDVSKLTLDFDCLPVSAAQPFANDAVGVAAVVTALVVSSVMFGLVVFRRLARHRRA